MAALWVYYTLLLGWLIAFALKGDWGGLLTPVNALAIYLFVPLPLAIVGAVFTRRLDLWGGALAGLIAFAWLWGSLFIPVPNSVQATGNPMASQQSSTLTVMTYNLLGTTPTAEPALAVIRIENPDIICLQELSPILATEISRELSDIYPYQILDPKPGVTGMGIISRYPLETSQVSLPLEWVGTPQVAEVQWHGAEFRLVNFHMSTPGRLTREYLQSRYIARQAQAQALVDLAGQTHSALILAGDANATHLNDAYKRITSGSLVDTWQQAGFGLGHTFPGRIYLVPGKPLSPVWLARIDHVFVSPHWRVQAVHTAPHDGLSDHRGVVTTLLLYSKGTLTGNSIQGK